MEAKFEYSKDYKEYLALTTIFLILFILFYFLSLAGSMYLAYWGIKIGLFLFNSVISFWIWLFAGGLILFSLLFLFMLSSYFFFSAKTDTSGLLEVKASEQPELYTLIREAAEAAGAPMPHKVYLSNDVNASVWMDVNFLSFIFPIRKKLILGMGLLHGLNHGTLKAVLGHEFAHFSQKVNQLSPFIYTTSSITERMIKEQAGYNVINEFVRFNAVFYIFGWLILMMLTIIQRILYFLYRKINEFNTQLSRDNEFRADYIGCIVAGSEAMKLALQQISEMEVPFQKSIQNLRREGIQQKTTTNLYKLVRQNKANSQADSKFQVPRIVFQDPESTHPETHERIERIESYQLPASSHSDEPALSLLKNLDAVETKLTSLFYITNNFKPNPEDTGTNAQEILQYPYPSPFDVYFRGRYPFVSLSDLQSEANAPVDPPTISKVDIDLQDEIELLVQERNILKDLLLNKPKIKYFSYQNVHYTRDQLETLIQKIDQEVEGKQLQIRDIDRKLVLHALHRWPMERARLLVQVTAYIAQLNAYKTTLLHTLYQMKRTNEGTNVDLAVVEKKFKTMLADIQSTLPELWRQLNTNSSIHRSASTNFSYFLGKSNLSAGLDRHQLEWEEIYFLLDTEAQSLMHELFAATG